MHGNSSEFLLEASCGQWQDRRKDQQQQQHHQQQQEQLYYHEHQHQHHHHHHHHYHHLPYQQQQQHQPRQQLQQEEEREMKEEAEQDTSYKNDTEQDVEGKEQLRRRKLLEFGFGASRRRPSRRTFRQRFNFYATSALAFVATSGGAALLFLVPLYVDPAISTLAADFSPEPVTCTTSRREELSGLFNCTWSSCREGCTSDVYKCTHIYVTYSPYSNATRNNITNDSENLTIQLTTNASSSVTAKNTSGEIVEAILLVNIKGCGYPPGIDCENFTRHLGCEGIKFPCYYSRVNNSIVMASYSRETQVAIIMHFFAAPFVVTLATSVALCVMHCDCRCAAPPRHSSRSIRRHRANDLSCDYIWRPFREDEETQQDNAIR
ncbi:protein tipE-like [Prorops nasuta]|uniref:protein tipE-like n=1 Tax=Prorops nasuta TaxID=863751 RepID=UPI0034CF9193